ncbi:MAG: hypothetical protein MUE40_21970 [Anaerolineae bacterium]|nr:hypothetical protein [Anaerolineae bacterium]
MVITLMLDAAAEVIDGYCNRPDGFLAAALATAKLFGGNGRDYLYCGDCVQVSQVEIKPGSTWEVVPAGAWSVFSGDAREPRFDVLPYGGVLLEGYVFPQVQRLPNVRITARWGYSATVPPMVKQAAIAQASRWYKRGQVGWSDTTSNEATGQLQYRRVLDPDIQMMLVNGRLMRPAM